MEAPEIIYITPHFQRRWFTKDIDDESIAYTRTDAFIEKVERFLEYKLGDRVEIHIAGTLIPSLTSKKAFIEDFRNFMKGE